MAIKSVWIEEGCIVCNACDAECPDVFIVTDNSSEIRAEVRQDGVQDVNGGHAPLKVELGVSLAEGIKAAAAGCPVEVIQFEEA